MADDIRFHERLLRLSDCIDGDPNVDENLWSIPKQALEEIRQLRRWKREAIEVLDRWDLLCGRTLQVAHIGKRKADAMATYIESQKAENATLRAEVERLWNLAGRLVAAVDSHHGMLEPIESHLMCVEIFNEWETYKKETERG